MSMPGRFNSSKNFVKSISTIRPSAAGAQQQQLQQLQQQQQQ